jgi:hypothetical protein
MVTTGNKRKGALREMADSYHHAHLRAVQHHTPKPHPLLNLIAADYALQALFPLPRQRTARKRKEKEGNTQLLALVGGLIKEKLTPDVDFWDAIASADYQLTLHVIEQTVAENVDVVVQVYRAAKQRGGSPREFRSVLEHVDFFIEMGRGDTKNQAGEKRLAALQDIKEKLTAGTG